MKSATVGRTEFMAWLKKKLRMLLSGSGIAPMIGRSYRKLYEWIKYSGYEPGHVFDIRVDDFAFKMTFMDYPLGRSIIERIEGRREPETTAIIKSLVEVGGNVLELGGCYGYFTTIMSKCVGEQGRVVTIEGTPNNYRILCENMGINGLKNVAAYNFFITAESDQVLFNVDDHDPYQVIGVLNSGMEQSGDVSVRTIRLTSFLEEISYSPDYIFCDIEDFETDVFADLSGGWLARHRPIIVFEVHPTLYKGADDLDIIMGILRKNEYGYRRVRNNLVCRPR